MEYRTLKEPKGLGSIPRKELKAAVKKVFRPLGNPPPLQKSPYVRKNPLKK